jgi:epoxyqueuosine reductase
MYDELDRCIEKQHYGICYLTPQICEQLSQRHQQLIEGLDVKTSFEPLPETRNFFRDLLSNDEGNAVVIVIAQAYAVTKPIKRDTGFIEGGASGEDYHRTLRQLLSKVAQIAINTLPLKNTDTIAYHVDTSPYIDREIAFVAGLGEYGRHHQLMTESSGAGFNIGYVVLPVREHYLSQEEEASECRRLLDRINAERLFLGCHTCNACVNACPVGICGEKEMARDRCISYTTQKKERLTEEEQRHMGRRIYGCSHCIYACPYDSDPIEDHLGEVDLIESLSLSQRHFKKKYGHTGIAWRGLRIFKRNCIIALNNRGIMLPQVDKDRFITDEFYKPYIK